MDRLRTFGHFWYDFVVGDDWRLALGVVVALGLTAIAHAAAGPSWWVMPATVAVILALSLWHAVRRRPVGNRAQSGSDKV
jgi:hypothetical protein